MLRSFSRLTLYFFIIAFLGNLVAFPALAGISGKSSSPEDVLRALQSKHKSPSEAVIQEKLELLKQKWESKHLSKIAPAQSTPAVILPIEAKAPVEIPASPTLGDVQATEAPTSSVLSLNLPLANVDSVTPPPVEPAPFNQAVSATESDTREEPQNGGLLKSISPITINNPPSPHQSLAQGSPFSLTLARLESKREKRNQEARQFNIVLPSQSHGAEIISPSLAKLNQALKQIISRNSDPSLA